jgi:hypothetical protein
MFRLLFCFVVSAQPSEIFTWDKTLPQPTLLNHYPDDPHFRRYVAVVVPTVSTYLWKAGSFLVRVQGEHRGAGKELDIIGLSKQNTLAGISAHNERINVKAHAFVRFCCNNALQSIFSGIPKVSICPVVFLENCGTSEKQTVLKESSSFLRMHMERTDFPRSQSTKFCHVHSLAGPKTGFSIS